MAGDMMLLKSSDDQIFEVKTPVATIILQNVFEDMEIAQPVFLPNVTGRVLSRVIEYLNFHSDHGKTTAESSVIDAAAWDKEFVQFDNAMLFDVILAANYLNIKNLLDLTCQAVAEQIAGKTPAQIHTHFNLPDITPEEEDAIQREFCT